MKLIDVLAGGVRGAEDGTVEIYRRGTSTFATVYSDYKGGGAQTPTAGLDLDSYGGLEVYVDEEVDCIAKSALGATVREFTVINTASSTEVKSQSFTGTDYDTALTGASYPLLLSTLLDLWKTNSGGKDWKVTVNGSDVTLLSAFSQVSGVFFNVKASTYGAKGDGVTDDTSAIAAAIAAAVAAGGGIVYFPAGTYLTTSVLTVGSTVSLLGAGAGASTISLNHATADVLQFTTASADPITIRGLRIRAAQANSGIHLKCNSGAALHIVDCSIGGTNTNGYCLTVEHNSSKVVATNNYFLHAGAASYAVFNDAAAPNVRLVGNRFASPSAHNGDTVRLNGGTSIVVGNWFDMSGTSSGTGRALFAAGSYTIAGNRFESPAGGTIIPITTSGTTAGNFIGLNSRSTSSSWSAASGPTAAASNATHEGCDEADRATRTYHVSSNVDPISVDPNLYGVAEVRRTTNANQTINGATPNAPGQMFTLVVNNDNGAGSGTITMGTGFKGLAPFTLAANRAQSITFRSYEVMTAGGGGANKYWGFVNTTGDVTL